MFKRQSFAVVAPALALFGLALFARPEQMIPLSIEELAGQSQLVLRGTVLGKTVQRDPAGRIYTAIDFQVAEVWRGTLATNRITLVHGGGVLGQERVMVTGQAEYQIGEEAVVFVSLNPRGEAVTIGLRQGKFKVTQDSTTGQKLAANGLPQRALGERAAGGHLAGSPARPALTLAELEQRVKAVKP